MTIVPTHTPPDVSEYFESRKKLLDPAYEPEESSVELIDNSKVTKVTKTLEPPQLHVEKPRGYKLTLTHNLYKVTFDVQDISVADYQLAIKVLKSDFRFEPQPNSRFTLECMGNTHHVVYLGGLFDFPSDASWSITFMLETEENDNTWTSST